MRQSIFPNPKSIFKKDDKEKQFEFPFLWKDGDGRRREREVVCQPFSPPVFTVFSNHQMWANLQKIVKNVFCVSGKTEVSD